jgi:hypothetical protein
METNSVLVHYSCIFQLNQVEICFNEIYFTMCCGEIEERKMYPNLSLELL